MDNFRFMMILALLVYLIGSVSLIVLVIAGHHWTAWSALGASVVFALFLMAGGIQEKENEQRKDKKGTADSEAD
jgi:hypothetical protein